MHNVIEFPNRPEPDGPDGTREAVIIEGPFNPDRAEYPRRNVEVAVYLRQLADNIEKPETVDISGAVIGVVQQEREPKLYWVHLDSWEWLQEISLALRDMWKSPNPQESVRRGWESRRETRRKLAAAKALADAETPFICECRRRFKTETGLKIHLRHCRNNRKKTT